ncbi:hypothetical protein EVAR_96805_1 [Eumeta japonica]|uniref:Uncharacterized protein n=1 Tax=Eumeta variegata TaxID=151549 RepID=A0A4C1W9Y8_EUMVA|nr:hypothetical protein EVAR_96805_1 [Eumeta japonica]
MGNDSPNEAIGLLSLLAASVDDVAQNNGERRHNLLVSTRVLLTYQNYSTMVDKAETVLCTVVDGIQERRPRRGPLYWQRTVSPTPPACGFPRFVCLWFIASTFIGFDVIDSD